MHVLIQNAGNKHTLACFHDTLFSGVSELEAKGNNHLLDVRLLRAEIEGWWDPHQILKAEC